MRPHNERRNGLLVLRALRDGVDPRDGAPLPEDHICLRPDVLRALCALVSDLEREPRRVPAAGALGSDAAGDPAAACGAEDETTEVRTAGEARRAARPRPARAGQPWNEDEDRRLAEAFDGGASLAELAESMSRTRASIRARLILLGRGALVEEGPAPRWPVRSRAEAAPVRT